MDAWGVGRGRAEMREIWTMGGKMVGKKRC